MLSGCVDVAKPMHVQGAANHMFEQAGQLMVHGRCRPVQTVVHICGAINYGTQGHNRRKAATQLWSAIQIAAGWSSIEAADNNIVLLEG
jgi:hypothetical protein